MENPARSPAPEFLMEVTDKTRADVKVILRSNLLLTFR